MQVAVDATATISLPRKTAPKLHPSQFFDATTRRNIWSVVPAHNTPYEGLFKPEYWGNVSRRLRCGDLIEVNAEDGTYFAVLYVMATAEQSAAVAEVSKVQLQADELKDSSEDFSVKWMGPILLWGVIRNKDGVRVATKLATRDAATQSLSDYIKALAR